MAWCRTLPHTQVGEVNYRRRKALTYECSRTHMNILLLSSFHNTILSIPTTCWLIDITLYGLALEHNLSPTTTTVWFLFPNQLFFCRLSITGVAGMTFGTVIGILLNKDHWLCVCLHTRLWEGVES